MNSPSRERPQPGHARIIFWDLLTFEKLLTGPVVHIIYWCGLAVIALPALVVGALVVMGLALLWRALCEFYVAIFRISDDLHAFRRSQNID